VRNVSYYAVVADWKYDLQLLALFFGRTFRLWSPNDGARAHLPARAEAPTHGLGVEPPVEDVVV
jgi:hypothetical protein